MNVLEYFHLKIDANYSDTDGAWSEIPVDSVCGVDCVKAIDAGVKILEVTEQAFGRHDFTAYGAQRQAIVNILDCFIYG